MRPIGSRRERQRRGHLTAMPGAGFATGNAVRVVVDGRRVATVILDRRSNGGVGGSVSLDSYGNAGDTGPGVTPFPPNWPGVTPQSVVQVASLDFRGHHTESPCDEERTRAELRMVSPVLPPACDLLGCAPGTWR